MEPSSVGTMRLCFAVLCSGAAFALNGEELRHQSTTKAGHVPETMGDPTTTTRDEGKLMTWPMASLTPLVTEVPVTTLVPTQTGAAENKTRTGPLPFLWWLLCSCFSSPTGGKRGKVGLAGLLMELVWPCWCNTCVYPGPQGARIKLPPPATLQIWEPWTHSLSKTPSQ
ncbi:uncharacterized protein LOC102086697 isoform X3 [Columba livia]|uniref:uncharacterized protein LOC102086697 isoform X3 n=1 Tax=Columba livia TaxID=8932 RepID=UPI000A3680F1|nr:uncharacterized protein LOC102086697 isoform X3 [Columba livia]